MSRLILSLLATLALIAATACSSGKNCTTLCTEAQAGGCTSIHGNCSNFCGAVDHIQGASGCTSARNEYQTCLNVDPMVCDNSCDSQNTAFSNCLAAYCGSHSSDPDCATIIGSL